MNGISNCFAWQLAKANALAEKEGFAKFVSIQGHYNLMFREEEREMAEEVFRGGSGEFSHCDDGETLEDLSGKLSCYYRDLDLYDEKRITAEDGETLYHTIKYIFKQLKKAGVRFK